jgi:hypothetical protein
MLGAMGEEQQAEPGKPNEREPVEGAADEVAEGPNIHQTHAALYAGFADGLADLAEHLAQTFETVKPEFTGPDAERTRHLHDSLTLSVTAEMVALANRSRLTAQANAAMSFAHQELMASGGTVNLEALARYQEAARWYQDLVNAEHPEGDISPQS